MCHPNWSNPWAFGPPKGMKNALCPATTLLGSATLPFVISTEAERRDLCVDDFS
jgi:hypothetical protein